MGKKKVFIEFYFKMKIKKDNQSKIDNLRKQKKFLRNFSLKIEQSINEIDEYLNNRRFFITNIFEDFYKDDDTENKHRSSPCYSLDLPIQDNLRSNKQEMYWDDILDFI